MKKKIPSILKEIRNTKLSEINYAIDRGISYSQLSIYNSCQHRWKLQYKDKIKIPSPSLYSVFGTAIHETIQHYLEVFYGKSGVEADKINLNEYFKEKYILGYKEQYKSNKNNHFSTPEEMREFFEDGVNILNFFKKKRGKYFSKKGWHLVGYEMPIVLNPSKSFPGVLFNGLIDIVLYHEPTNTFKIIDIKTSTRGWKDNEKKDQEKQNQILLYKKYFSEIYNIPLENVEIEFFIVKRKIPNTDEFVISRIQTFVPNSGKIKLKKAQTSIEKFISECFDMNGNIKEKEYLFFPSKSNCFFCPFNQTTHCNKGIR